MDQIDRIRAFNRFYTARLALLGRSYLGSGRALADIRVLHDLSAEPGTTARALAQRLGLDEGYLSRIVARMVEDGWIARRAVPGDKRQRALALTPEGEAVAAEMRRRSRAEIAGVIAGMGAPAQAALVDAMQRIEVLLSGSAAPVVLRPMQPGDAGWVIERHGALYAREEGYDATFEALVARIVAGYLETRDPERETAWIAEQAGRRLGSVFVVRVDDAVAKLRLFLIEPEARGLGLGRRMLAEAMSYARDRGYRRMVLWTHESHRAACALYAATGWRMTSATPGHQFGVDLVDQEWEIDL